jgi:hypothetical protein
VAMMGVVVGHRPWDSPGAPAKEDVIEYEGANAQSSLPLLLSELGDTLST